MRIFDRFVSGILSLFAFALLSACGTYTPDFNEFWGNSNDTDDKLRLIVEQVACEIKRAVQLVEADDIRLARDSSQGRQLKWLEDWGADANFIFTVEEKSTLSPTVAINKVLNNYITRFPGGVTVTTPQSYSTGIGVQGSSDGYRQDKVHVFFKIKDLVGPESDLESYEYLVQRATIA